MSCLFNALSSCCAPVASFFSSLCCSSNQDAEEVRYQRMEEGRESGLFEGPRPMTMTMDREDTLRPLSERNVSPIILSSSSIVEVEQVPAQVLEGQPGQFYIGVNTPKSIVKQAQSWAGRLIPPEGKVLLEKHPHTTLAPPNPKLHPSKPLESMDTTLDLEFNEFTITPRGNINLLGKNTRSYTAFTREIAAAHGGEATTRAPHSVIGRITNPEVVRAMFENPEAYGFKYDQSRNILVRKIREPQTFEVVANGTRPVEQRLLATAHGQGVALKKPLERNPELEQRFIERQETISKVQVELIATLGRGRIFTCPEYRDPVHFNYIAIQIAVHGDPKYGRVPLTFTLAKVILGKEPTERDIREGLAMWGQFREDVSNELVRYGYTDADVSLLGSATTGFSGNPTKPLKAWTPNSDVDCAIFSTRLAGDFLSRGGMVNEKIQMMGKLSVFKNAVPTDEPVYIGFHDLPVGRAFAQLQEVWTTRIFGEPGTPKPQIGTRSVEIIQPDEVDFKLNIGDRPFRGNAITFHAADHTTL